MTNFGEREPLRLIFLSSIWNWAHFVAYRLAYRHSQAFLCFTSRTDDVMNNFQHGDGGRSQFRVAVIYRSSMAEGETSNRKAFSTLPFQNQEVWDAFCFTINYEKPFNLLILRVWDCASDVNDRILTELRNTCISLNNKSAYCVMSHSLKRSDTCEWSGRIFMKLGILFLELVSNYIHFRALHVQVVSFHNGDSCQICTIFSKRSLTVLKSFPHTSCQ